MCFSCCVQPDMPTSRRRHCRHMTSSKTHPSLPLGRYEEVFAKFGVPFRANAKLWTDTSGSRSNKMPTKLINCPADRDIVSQLAKTRPFFFSWVCLRPTKTYKKKTYPEEERRCLSKYWTGKCISLTVKSALLLILF